MPIKLGIVMDPIAEISYKKDSSLAMLWAAQEKSWELFYIQPSQLYIEDGTAKAKFAALEVFHDETRWVQTWRRVFR